MDGTTSQQTEGKTNAAPGCMIVYLPKLQTLPTKATDSTYQGRTGGDRLSTKATDSTYQGHRLYLPRPQTLPTKATDSTYQGRTGGDRFSTKGGVDRLSLPRLELTDSTKAGVDTLSTKAGVDRLFQGWS